jgi:tellurite resistance protein TerC
MLDTSNIWLWVGFLTFVLGMLALDLGVFHRKAHTVSLKEAATWSVVWVAISLIFNAFVYRFIGSQQGIEFLTGYLIEKSLSVDNIFVFVLIFSYFNVPSQYQHRVLFWGVLGALVMRAFFILVGVQLLSMFWWMVLVFGGFLIFTGVRMAFHQDEEIHPEANPVIRLFKRFMPVTTEYHGQKFFIRDHVGKLIATPLFMVLILVESTDLLFAVDSIPAILAISTDPFIVFTSNVFAILGLRALYFLLAGVMDKFRYLKQGLAVILVYVGFKMVISHWYHIPTVLSLGVIAFVLTISVVVSLWHNRRDERIAAEQQRNLAAK